VRNYSDDENPGVISNLFLKSLLNSDFNDSYKTTITELLKYDPMIVNTSFIVHENEKKDINFQDTREDSLNSILKILEVLPKKLKYKLDQHLFYKICMYVMYYAKNSYNMG